MYTVELGYLVAFRSAQAFRSMLALIIYVALWRNENTIIRCAVA